MKALILAAGKGTRLGDLTKQTPKCLVEVAGKPMLAHVVECLKRAGIQEAIVNLNHLSDQVRAAVEANKGFGIKISFSHEDALLGTGGGLKKVERFFEGESEALVVNADLYFDFPLKELIAKHRAEKNFATLLTMRREEASYLLFDKNQKLSGYEVIGKRLEHVNPSEQGARAAFCGIQILSSEIFETLRVFDGEFSLIEVYMKAAKEKRVVRSHDLGAHYWIDMGSPEKLELLRQHLSKT